MKKLRGGAKFLKILIFSRFNLAADSGRLPLQSGKSIQKSMCEYVQDGANFYDSMKLLFPLHLRTNLNFDFSPKNCAQRHDVCPGSIETDSDAEESWAYHVRENPVNDIQEHLNCPNAVQRPPGQHHFLGRFEPKGLQNSISQANQTCPMLPTISAPIGTRLVCPIPVNFRAALLATSKDDCHRNWSRGLMGESYAARLVADLPSMPSAHEDNGSVSHKRSNQHDGWIRAGRCRSTASRISVKNLVG